jgi:carbamoyl-phosphate synthase small subunit
MKGTIVLENGTVFTGLSSGFEGTRFGEFVFNTAMTGYQEILTDPSYMGQFVVMTYPHIGNYGVNDEDVESDRIHVEGFVAKEFSTLHSNYRAQGSLQDYLRKQKVILLEGIDTRSLTKLIREKGAMMGAISNVESDPKKLLDQVKAAPPIVGRDLIKAVTVKKAFKWDPKLDFPGSTHPRNRYYDGLSRLKERSYGFHIVVVDCGVKWNMVRILSLMGNSVTVVPATASFEEIVRLKPDGVLVSNGPGDPEPAAYVARTVARIVESRLPVFGICMGQHMLVMALGGKTFKLKFGHHGANHPVKDLLTGKVEITSQNHNFCADLDSLDRSAVEVTHLHLNDGTAEGIRHKELPVFSVQYHPESSPGPNDSRYLFKRFLEMIASEKKSNV